MFPYFCFCSLYLVNHCVDRYKKLKFYNHFVEFTQRCEMYDIRVGNFLEISKV